MHIHSDFTLRSDFCYPLLIHTDQYFSGLDNQFNPIRLHDSKPNLSSSNPQNQDVAEKELYKHVDQTFGSFNNRCWTSCLLVSSQPNSFVSILSPWFIFSSCHSQDSHRVTWDSHGVWGNGPFFFPWIPAWPWHPILDVLFFLPVQPSVCETCRIFTFSI